MDYSKSDQSGVSKRLDLSSLLWDKHLRKTDTSHKPDHSSIMCDLQPTTRMRDRSLNHNYLHSDKDLKKTEDTSFKSNYHSTFNSDKYSSLRENDRLKEIYFSTPDADKHSTRVDDKTLKPTYSSTLYSDRDSRKTGDTSFKSSYNFKLNSDKYSQMRENDHLKESSLSTVDIDKHTTRREDNTLKPKDSYSMDIDSKLASIQHLNDKLNSLSVLDSDIYSKREDISKLKYSEKKNDELKTEIENIHKLLDEALEKNKELVIENTTLKDKIIGQEKFQRMLNTTLENSEKILMENTSLKNNIDEINDINVLLDEALEKNKRLKTENNLLNDKVNDQRKFQRILDKTLQEKEKLVWENTFLKENIDKIKSKVDKPQDESDSNNLDLKENLKNLQIENKNLAQSLAEMDSNLKKKTAAVITLRDKYKLLKQDCEASEQINQLKSYIASLQKQLGSSKDEINRLNILNSDKDTQLELSHRQRKSLEAEIENIKLLNLSPLKLARNISRDRASNSNEIFNEPIEDLDRFPSWWKKHMATNHEDHNQTNPYNDFNV